MFAVIATVLFAISWFEHGAGSGSASAWFNSQGTLILGLVALALHMCAPWTPWKRG
jgi:hypothetical protein